MNLSYSNLSCPHKNLRKDPLSGMRNSLKIIGLAASGKDYLGNKLP